jgi:hypothetical protein
MRQVTVIYRNRSEPTKVLTKNKLQWYDPLKKEMQHFEGGCLEFEYIEDQYLVAIGSQQRSNQGIHSTFRLLPKAVDLEIISTHKVSDNKKFLKFFDNYLNYNMSEITAKTGKENTICFVPNDEFEDFSYQLERHGFNYEI